MKERYKNVIVADLMLLRENKKTGKTEVLLSLRKNTGSNDGEYELPGGHLEEGEDLIQAMIREAKEELNIELNYNDLKIVHILHHYTDGRMNFILTTQKYEGILKINEPNKCEKLEWFDFENIPENTTYKVKNTLKEIQNNIFYDNINFERINNI